MEELYNKALNICRLFIGAIPVVTDEQINTAIEQVSFMPDFKMLDKHILKKKLLAHYGVRIQDFQILEGNDRRLPWLKEFKANKISNWNFWTRYKLYLSEQKGYAPAVINQLDEITDRILDNLFNPQQVNISIDKKGLVVGQVQSGKTANYTGLICKAADAGLLNSTCKCNRILINNLFKFFVWREVSKSFTRSIIEFIFNPLNLFVGYFTKVLTLWDILPDKPVGVFIGTTFP